MKSSKLGALVMFVVAILFVVACSKDNTKNETSGLDLSILNEQKYWKLDSVKFFYDEVFVDTEVSDIYYMFNGDHLIIKEDDGYDYTDTTQYQIMDHTISFDDADKYWRIRIADLNRSKLVINKVWNKGDVARAAADSLYEYLSPVTKSVIDEIFEPK